MKKFVKFKTMMIIVLIGAMLVTQVNICFAGSITNNNYLALQANKYKLSKNVYMNGNAVQGGVEDYSSAIFYFLSGEDTVTDAIHTEKNYTVDKPVYCSNKVNINVDSFINNAILASGDNININSKSITSDGIAVIFSKTGNIDINCDNIDFDGIIYAPNGKVNITSENFVLNGCIIADEVKINSKRTELLPNEESENLLSFLKAYKNEGYMCLDAYVEEGNLGVYCDSNLYMSKGTIYVRYDDEKIFKNIGEFEKNQGTISNFNFNEKLDVIVQGRTEFGEIIESDVVSLEKDNEGKINYVKQDSDNDGIEDGIEIFYLKSNPNNEDTDGDGIGDGIEAYSMYTNPAKANKTDEDFDKDGVTNFEEISINTNPYLEDTDFDGKKDKNDNNPKKYNKHSKIKEEQAMTLGVFDRIITYIDEDGNCSQCVYDFINEKVKMETKGDLSISYYYDYEMNLSSKITSYNGETKINNYEYDGEMITAIYNNGYKYGFLYDEENRLLEVELNDDVLIKYEYSDNSERTMYANGSYIVKNSAENNATVDKGTAGDYVYTFDETNNSTTYEFIDNGLTITYGYDQNGELKSVETNTGFRISYDKSKGNDGSISTITYRIDGEIYSQVDKVEYNAETGKKIKSTLITGDTVEKYCDADNCTVEKYTINNNEYINKTTYGENLKVESIEYNDNSNIVYRYDSNNNITNIKENGNTVNEYEYDELNRLVSEIDCIGKTKTIYTYDLCDNIENVKKYVYDNNKEGELLSSASYEYSDVYGDQLVNYCGKSIIYDNSGKPLSYYNGSEFTWEGDNLIGALVGEKNIKFEIDNNGKVAKKNVNGTETVYGIEGTDYIYETTDGKTIIYLYDSDAKLIGFTYENNVYYYVKNAMDDIIKIVDSKNEFVCGYTYDAWGNIIRIDGNRELAEINKFRYRSYYYDTDMNMYYLNSRYYDSLTGRFISTDMIDMMVYNEDNLNLYAYCKNNPVYYIDPEGTSVKLAVFTLTCWRSESENVMQDFEEYLGFGTVSFEMYSSNNMNDYERNWNNLSNARYVVMNTHANPEELVNATCGFKDSDRLTISEINNLSYKNITVLILLGCNAGHYDYVFSNVAFAFSKRISGVVVASDGTVQSGYFNSIGTASFTSIGDITFDEKCGTNRANLGWIIYKHSRSSSGPTLRVFTNIMKLTVHNIMDKLSANNYYSYFK